MTANITEAQAIVASTAAKVEQGNVSENDFEELRKVARENPEAIPFLNRSFVNGNADTPPPSGTVVVRFFGMVHDMLETEYYLSEVNGVKAHYRDALLEEEPNDVDFAQNLAERQPLVVVPIPFTCEWLKKVYSTTANNDHNNVQASTIMEEENGSLQNKREGDAMEDPPSKRKALSSTPDTSLEDDSMDAEDKNASSSESQHATGSSTNNDWWPAGCMKSDVNQCPVLAKLYYDQEQSSPRLKLNEVVELIGVVSLDPMHADFSQQQSGEPIEDEWNDYEFSNMTLPPPSLLQRLHVLCYNRINLESVEPKKESTSDMNMESTNGDDRSFAIQVFSRHVFGGNETAAEALLMACMSMAERELLASDETTVWAPIKTPSDTTLGCASLNLILSSQESCDKMSIRLQQVLSKILPIVGSVDLSREQLGKTFVSPAKDETCGRLCQSPLQLPKGSALVVNESMLSEGRIEARAEETLRALGSLTQSHSVPYRFEGMMNYNFEADYRVIVLSKSETSTGSKLLPCSLTMKLSDEVLAEEPTEAISLKDCQRIRSYLAQCRCSTANIADEVCNVPLSKSLLEQAQNDFIAKRAEYRKKKELRKRMESMAVGDASVQLEPLGEQVEEADFHRWLTLARLQARSCIPSGPSDENIESEVWADTLRLDEAIRS